MKVRHFGVLLLAALLITAALPFPHIAHADFEAPPPPAATIYAAHAGVALNNASEAVMRGAELDSIDTSWTIDARWINHDVLQERTVWAIFRGEEGDLVGAPEVSVNYALAHQALLGNATTTLAATFDLQAFGDPDTPSGIYTIVVAELPETYYEYDEALGDLTGVERPFTSGDFVNWFAGSESYNSPVSYRSIEFEYIAGEAEIPCTEHCYSNVLFLPGIEASRLYTDDGKVWEPGLFDDLHNLHINPSGDSVRPDVHVRVRDVLDEDPIGRNIYKSFIEDMDELASAGAIAAWEPVAYDWRLSIDDILASGKHDGNQISYTKATSSPYIIQQLRHLAATSKSGKVTIVAHSNGGLLAKRLTQVLGEEASELIDKMIFVAVPQAGTPDALAIALHGENIGPLGVIASASAVRTFASTSPMLYHLLPSADYFTYVDDPVVEFDESLPDWIAEYGDVIHSEERLKTFVTGAYGKAQDASNTVLPGQLRDDLFEDASTLHDSLDDWQPPSGVELVQIAGWGIPKTVAGIKYKKFYDFEEQDFVSKPSPQFTIDGDGRVIVPSALWSSANAATNYWLDLRLYNLKNRLESSFGLNSFEHSRILEVSQLNDFLSDYITTGLKPLDEYVYISTQALNSPHGTLSFALHSPLTLDLYDSAGNHTGVSTTTNLVEENIPGTYYMTFGEQQYIFADSSNEYHLALDGYDSGTFTLIISETEGDAITSSVAFEDVPVTPETIVSLTVSSGTDSISMLSVDEDGDGENDFTVSTDGTTTQIQDVEEAVLVAPISSGGGPPVGLLSQSTSTPPIVPVIPTTTATSSEALAIAVVPAAARHEPATVISAKKTEVLKPVKKVAKPTTLSVSKPLVVSQVASAAQSTKSNLWTQIFNWIMKRLNVR